MNDNIDSFRRSTPPMPPKTSDFPLNEKRPDFDRPDMDFPHKNPVFFGWHLDGVENPSQSLQNSLRNPGFPLLVTAKRPDIPKPMP